MVDPNVYALSISLAFDATDAFRTLDDFGQQVSDLETDVSTAAQKAIKSIGQIAEEATRHLTDFTKQLGDIDSNTIKINTNLTDASKELKDQFDNGEDRLEDIEEELEFNEKMFELSQELSKELKTQLDLNNEFLMTLGKVVGAVGLKNQGHLEQNNLLRTDNQLIGEGADGIDKQGKGTDRLNKRTKELSINWNQIWGFIKAADAETEKFVATNYRAYGSQQQLLQSARNLQMTQGVLHKDAVEAYAILGNLKVPREELDKYAEIVSKTSRATQVGVAETAEYANKLRVVGLTEQGVERHLVLMTEAMRKFGLSSSDVQKVMSGTAEEMLHVKGMFGGSAEAVEKFQESTIVMAGFAKSVGLGAEASKEYHSWLTKDAMAMEMLGAYTKMRIKTVDDLRQAELKAALQTEDKLTSLEQQLKDGTISIAKYNIELEVMKNLYYGGSEGAMQTSREMGKQAKAMKLTGASAEEYNQLLEKIKNQLSDPTYEANQTFTAQLRILNETFTNLMATVGQFAADTLMPLIRALNEVIQWLVKTSIAINDVIKKLEQIPVIGKVITFIKWAGIVVLGLGIALVVAAAAIITFGASIGWFGTAMQKMTAGVKAFADMIVIMAETLGKVIEIILESIGKGLQSLGNSIKGVVGPLLALGLALLMVGIGAYFFAMGVRIIAEMGAAAVPALLGMILAIAILGLVLIGLAMLIQGPVAVGLIVLAIALLAVGIAALLVGMGINMAAQGFVALAAVLTPELIMNFFLLGLAIVALGAMAMIAAPGLIVFAVALLIVGVAAILIATAFSMMAAVINTISADAIPALAQAFMVGALYMAAAGAVLMVAATILIVAATLLLVAVALLLPAVGILLVVGLALFIGATLFFVGAMLLGIAGIMILIGGVGIMIGSIALLFGLGMLSLAIPLMLGVGVALLVGAGLMTAGAAALMTVGVMVMIGGTGVYVGALMLNLAGQLLVNAVQLFAQAGNGFVGAAAAIIGGLLVLVSIGPLMIMAGYMLLIGSAAIAAAGVVLLVGMTFMVAAAGMMFMVGMQIGIGGMMMLIGAQSLVAAAGLLGASAGYISTSLSVLLRVLPKIALTAMVMLPIGAALYAASTALAAGCLLISVAGMVLLVGATMLMAGASVLEPAVMILWGSAPMMMGASFSIMMASYLLIGAVVLLLVGAYMLLTAATIIITASFMLLTAGAMLQPAAMSIFSGLLWLEFAVSRFSRTIDRVILVSSAISLLAHSFASLKRTPMGGLRALTEEAFAAVPNIEKLGNSLIVAAKKLDEGVRAFEGPAERLNAILSRLTETITAFGQGLNLTDDVSKLAAMLDNYANLLENASERIETAVASKAMPAIKAAEEAGIEQTVRSEAISTVQVMDKTEGQSGGSYDQNTLLMTKMNDTLVAINERLGEMQTGRGELSEIVTLLQTYLPDMGKGDSALGSEMNSWAK